MQDNDKKLGYERLLNMARGVAQGMDYLSTVGFVHRVSPFVFTIITMSCIWDPISESPNVLTQNTIASTDGVMAYEQI